MLTALRVLHSQLAARAHRFAARWINRVLPRRIHVPPDGATMEETRHDQLEARSGCACCGAHREHARIAKLRAGSRPRKISPERAHAIHECSVLADQYPEYDWGNMEIYQYRACMAEHGQEE